MECSIGGGGFQVIIKTFPSQLLNFFLRWKKNIAVIVYSVV